MTRINMMNTDRSRKIVTIRREAQDSSPAEESEPNPTKMRSERYNMVIPAL